MLIPKSLLKSIESMINSKVVSIEDYSLGTVNNVYLLNRVLILRIKEMRCREGEDIGDFRNFVKATKILKKNNIHVSPRVIYSSEYYENDVKNQVLLLEKIPGSTLAELLELHPQDFIYQKLLASKITDLLVSLHKIRIEGCGEIRLNKKNDSWNDYIIQSVKDKLVLIGKFNLLNQSEISEILSRFESNNKLLQLSETSFLHRDVQPQNIIVNDEGIKLIDFDSSSSGDPIFDFYGFDWNFRNKYPFMFKTIINQYKEIKNIDKFDEKYQIYKLYFYIKHIIPAYYLWGEKTTSSFQMNIRSALRN